MQEIKTFANTIRVLTIDAINKAQSGHPGMPLGMAEIMATLWLKHLNHNPKNPNWINRDRFILSNGHGSMLLYALLHLTGYDLSIDDIKGFRQLNSLTPGHPEYFHTKGVETSTGPLGQGFANAVGMAVAEKILGNNFNKENHNIIDHYTYVSVGDGCLMEGISYEVCSLAGLWKLNKLIVLYDCNNISIDGHLDDWFNSNIEKQFIGCGWCVINSVDGHNIHEIDNAICTAKQNTKPTIIIFHTIIGKGAKKVENTSLSHGKPLSKLDIKNFKDSINWQYDDFYIPDEIYKMCSCVINGIKKEEKWNHLYIQYTSSYPQLADELMRRKERRLIDNWSETVNNESYRLNNEQLDLAIRASSKKSLNYFYDKLPELLGGSADLTESTQSMADAMIPFTAKNNFSGSYIYYGVREFGMTAIANGIYLYGCFKPYVSTFLMFSEYARNAIRMAALMKIAPIFIYTHDSILLGEDGPTHQPVEQLSTLRLIPNIDLWRPCDCLEVHIAWSIALASVYNPTILIFAKQSLPAMKRDRNISDIYKGAYILHSNSLNPLINIIASGSEVSTALFVYNKLLELSYSVQLVSMPSTTTFDKQDELYKKNVISKAKYKIVIEFGSTDLWYKYVGLDGLIIGINSFGKSAKPSDLKTEFGLTNEQVLSKVKMFIEKGNTNV